MRPPGNDDVVRYTILDETGQHDVLLFGCEKCPPDKKLTSSMLETHMRDRHDAARFTVSDPSTDPDEIVKDAGTVIAMSEGLSKILEEGPEKTERTSPDRRERQRYNRPVPGPRQPRQG